MNLQELKEIPEDSSQSEIENILKDNYDICKSNLQELEKIRESNPLKIRNEDN